MVFTMLIIAEGLAINRPIYRDITFCLGKGVFSVIVNCNQYPIEGAGFKRWGTGI